MKFFFCSAGDEWFKCGIVFDSDIAMKDEVVDRVEEEKRHKPKNIRTIYG